jgi:hypothetical protein
MLRRPLLSENIQSRLPLTLLSIGALERLAWLFFVGGLGYAEGEAANVAIAFARSGEFADTFARSSGLSAHLNPVMPAIAGTIYALLGVRSVPAEIVLAAMSITFTLLAALLFFRAAALVGMRRRARLAALGLFCLIPLNPQLETTTFRIWEGAFATMLSAWALLLILRADSAGRVDLRRTLPIALITALLFFINPALGVACYACAAILLLRRVPSRKWPTRIAVGAVALAGLLTPWTIRNYQAFGKFIPLRSNLGLELALANHELTTSGQLDGQVFKNRLATIHPLESQRAFDRMQQMGGEIAYAHALGAEAKQWIANNPSAFALNSVKHVFQFYFPPTWQWDIYRQVSRGTWLKATVTWTIALLGIAGALAALLWWRGAWIYVVVLTFVPVLPTPLSSRSCDIDTSCCCRCSSWL